MLCHQYDAPTLPVSFEGQVKRLLLTDDTTLPYSSLAVTGDAFHY